MNSVVVVHCHRAGGRRFCDLESTAGSLSSEPARRRQLLWVVGELHRWHEAAGGGVELARCADLLGLDLDAYLEAAGLGELRLRERPSSRAPSAASDRVRRQCLRMLAGKVGTAIELGGVRGTAAPEAREGDLHRFLAWSARDLTNVGMRTAAVAHLAACGLRVGELVALDVVQVGDHVLVDVTRSDPGPGESWVEDVVLSDGAHDALGRWLALREQVVASERVTQVFLGLGGAASSKGPHAAGHPVSARTLDRSHRNAVRTHLAVRNPGLAEPRAIDEFSLTRISTTFSDRQRPVS